MCKIGLISAQAASQRLIDKYLQRMDPFIIFIPNIWLVSLERLSQVSSIYVPVQLFLNQI